MPDDPASEILDATYRALCKHGYANLTLQDVAAEADTSKASILYHHDSKDQLFVAFLDELYDQFTDRVNAHDGETPRDQLEALLRVFLTTEDDSSQQAFRTAILELTSQAPYNSALQDRLSDFDEFLIERLRGILVAGVDAGQFDDAIEPTHDAEYLATTITGAHIRHVAIDRSSDNLYGTMTNYVERHLLTDTHPEVAQ